MFKTPSFQPPPRDVASDASGRISQRPRRVLCIAGVEAFYLITSITRVQALQGLRALRGWKRGLCSLRSFDRIPNSNPILYGMLHRASNPISRVPINDNRFLLELDLPGKANRNGMEFFRFLVIIRRLINVHEIEN